MNHLRRYVFASLLLCPMLTAAMPATESPPTPQRLYFAADGDFPNTTRPVLFYPSAWPSATADLAAQIETRFAHNGWVPQWRYPMYPFDHFHSTAHEALGIYQGTATLRLGGPDGRLLKVKAGDVLILPAGMSHRSWHASADFMMVGAYPAGQHWDMQRGDQTDLHALQQRIAAVPVPATDPLGQSLSQNWSAP